MKPLFFALAIGLTASTAFADKESEHAKLLAAQASSGSAVREPGWTIARMDNGVYVAKLNATGTAHSKEYLIENGKFRWIRVVHDRDAGHFVEHGINVLANGNQGFIAKYDRQPGRTQLRQSVEYQQPRHQGGRRHRTFSNKRTIPSGK